jgi:ferredoxin-thioredoxin reductase catalytic subunit
LVDSVADRAEEEGWSICPCREVHGQDEVNLGTAAVMRRHAALARGLREQAAG